MSNLSYQFQPSVTDNSSIGAMYYDNKSGGINTIDNGVVSPMQPINPPKQAPSGPVDTSFTDPLGTKWASRAAYDANMQHIRSGAGVKQGGYQSEAENTLRGNANTFRNDSQDLVTGMTQGQNTINTGRANNALNLRRSMAGIASGIRQGIRSGGVNLANMNALDSGASNAMAMAFARQGNSQAGQVNNESQIAENNFATEQQNLSIQQQQGVQRLKATRENAVRAVSDKLFQNLRELDADVASKGVTGAVDMGIRDRVIAQANAELNQIDQQTQAELAKVQGLSYDQVQERAQGLDQAGAQVANPFAVEGGRVQFGQGQGSPVGAPLGQIAQGPRYRDEEVRPAFFRPEEEQIAY